MEIYTGIILLIFFAIYVWLKYKIDNKYFIGFIIFSILIYFKYNHMSEKYIKKYENFEDNKDNKDNNLNNTDIGINNIKSTKLSERQVTFTLERPERPEEKYNNKFNEISKEKPLVREFDDSVFSDVIYYENDDYDSPDEANKNVGGTGLEKCLNLCNGRCIEFGQTNNAFCFPKRSPEEAIKTSYYERLLDPNDEDEKKQIINKLDYPNLR